MKRTSALIVLLVVAAWGGCQCQPRFEGPDGGDDAGPDAGDAGPLCGAATCSAANVCIYGACIPPPPGCSSNDQCINDSRCELDGGSDAGRCIPYELGANPGFNPQCARLVSLGLFSPVEACSWTGPPPGDPYPNHANVLSTPLVADFDFDDDLESPHPSIVFTTYNCEDGASGQEPGCYGVIRVVDGKTCQQQFNVGGSGDTTIIGSTTPALGDLDGDGRPDIAVHRRDGGVLGFTFVPSMTGGSFVELFASTTGTNAINQHWDSLALHDLDDDGVPEIVQNGPFPAAFDNAGALIHQAAISTNYSRLLHPVLFPLADVGVAMADGREVFLFDAGSRQWQILTTSAQALGHTAIADFGTYSEDGLVQERSQLDGVPEMAVVSSSTVRVQTLGGRVVFGPLPLFAGGVGGAPTVADFDGDGRAELAVAGGSAYSVYDLDCLPGGDAGWCSSETTDGRLWSQTSQDLSSNVSGSSVFDFDGDGRAEAVYADECFSRIYDGRSGVVLFSQFHTSCTWYENPVVADTAGDFHTKLIIPSNSNCNITCPALDPIHPGLTCDDDGDCPTLTTCGREVPSDVYGMCRCSAPSDCASPGLDCVDPISGASPAGKVCRARHPIGQPQRGIQVMRDVQNRWVPSRRIWNQHAYSVTNIYENGTVPRTSQWAPNWTTPGLNNYRMNVQGSLSPGSVPDMTTAGTYSCDDQGNATLAARVCNRGTAPVAAGVPVAFYAGTQAVCVVPTPALLNPGHCSVLQCGYPTDGGSPVDVQVVADDDGAGGVTQPECSDSNNLGVIPQVMCGIIG